MKYTHRIRSGYWRGEICHLVESRKDQLYGVRSSRVILRNGREIGVPTSSLEPLLPTECVGMPALEWTHIVNQGHRVGSRCRVLKRFRGGVMGKWFVTVLIEGRQKPITYHEAAVTTLGSERDPRRKNPSRWGNL